MLKKHFKSFLAIFCILNTIFFIISCGKRRPPLPPVARQKNLADLTITQQGNLIVLKISPSNSSMKDQIKQIEIYRLAQARSAQSSFYSEEEFASRSTLVGVLPVQSSQSSNPTVSSNFYTFTDQLNALQPNVRLNYAIRLISENDRRSGFSSLTVIEPNFKIANPPVLTKITNSEKIVKIVWDKPNSNVDQTSPASLLGYNIYRRKADSSTQIQKLNQSPLTETIYEDSAFEFDQEYLYFVRSISLGNNNALVESSDSNSLSIKLIDVFAPAPPQGLTVAAAPNRLSLFFAANNEPDLAGYNLYRSLDSLKPLEQWNKINSVLLTTTSFQDLQVESNQKYFYYLKAVDRAGNSSEASAVVSETVP